MAFATQISKLVLDCQWHRLVIDVFDKYIFKCSV